MPAQKSCRPGTSGQALIQASRLSCPVAVPGRFPLHLRTSSACASVILFSLSVLVNRLQYGLLRRNSGLLFRARRGVVRPVHFRPRHRARASTLRRRTRHAGYVRPRCHPRIEPLSARVNGWPRRLHPVLCGLPGGDPATLHQSFKHRRTICASSTRGAPRPLPCLSGMFMMFPLPIAVFLVESAGYASTQAPLYSR